MCLDNICYVTVGTTSWTENLWGIFSSSGAGASVTVDANGPWVQFTCKDSGRKYRFATRVQSHLSRPTVASRSRKAAKRCSSADNATFDDLTRIGATATWPICSMFRATPMPSSASSDRESLQFELCTHACAQTQTRTQMMRFWERRLT